MALTVRGNTNRTGYEEVSPGHNSGVTGWLLFSITWPTVSGAIQDAAKWASATNVFLMRVTGPGGVQFGYVLNAVGTTTWVTVGTHGTKIDCFGIWNDATKTLDIYANGSLVTSVDYTGDSIRADGDAHFVINGSGVDGEDFIIHDLAYGSTLIDSDDVTDYDNGTSPADFSATPSIYYSLLGSGYSASIAAAIGALTFDQINITVGETDEGSANAPFLDGATGFSALPPALHDLSNQFMTINAAKLGGVLQ